MKQWVSVFIFIVFFTPIFLISQDDRSNSAPTSNFIFSSDRICPNQTVEFSDKSIDHDSTYYWEFEGGIPEFSDEQNPVVTYPNEGNFDVSLTVYNTNGSSKVTRLNIINVEYPAQINLDVRETFESPVMEHWSIINPDGQITWVIDTLAGGFGLSEHSLRMNNYSYNSDGAEDILVSDPISFVGQNGPIMLFDFAYAPYGTTYYDTLRLYYSDDCGLTRNLMWEAGGDDLTTIDSTITGLFIPSPSEWRTEYLYLTNYGLDNRENITFYFVNFNYYGNELYLDNINISDPSAIGENKINHIRVFPNPTSESIQISGIPQHEIEQVFIYNSIGKLCKTSINEFNINVSNLSTGIYFMTVTTSNGKIYKSEFIRK